ncbi:DUF3857 domain-containing protein [Gramella sp. AN32]|uniref:DUF3857 domain-containing protein n=1 Tax=Christiangramia antarctica TaxID=2058158 RepID=A0ABW5X4S9_9FLAO|nr:DUF3857 domain-containing protein [Gramella sp. AN32]MCM4157193.1 hypothetical protein [Gramella sp. AN32]
MRQIFFPFMLCLFFSYTYSQDHYSVTSINPKLTQNANAVVRDFKYNVEIKDVDEIIITTERVVTVLNSKGNRYIQAYQNYDEAVKIDEQEALIYDANGKEIDKIKKKNFKDVSNYQSFVLFSDNRVSYLDYTPRSYPYTVKYTSIVENENSLFLKPWFPVDDFQVSIENAEYKIVNPNKIPLRFSEKNLEGLQVESENNDYEVHYTLNDFAALEKEILSPPLRSLVPNVRVAIHNFHIEGKKGAAENWKDFGKWQYENLVQGHDELSEESKNKITALTLDAQSLEEKAAIVYHYVQENTRYIAIMLGIGGIEPAPASEVDRLGYGDCKGLTNYTKALLKSQGIESFYTIVHANDKIDIDPHFTNFQGNHVILNIPRKDEDDIWLECTSQYAPFNYLGNFTDDRYVLRLKPEGGEIIRTKKYGVDENLQMLNGTIHLQEDGNYLAKMERITKGIEYGDTFHIERQTEKDQKSYFRNEWSNLQNIQFEKIEFENDRDNVVFTEQIDFTGSRLASKAGKRLLLSLNFVNNSSLILGKNDNRKYPVRMERGKTYKDHFEYVIPENYTIESIPESSEFNTEFGEFTFTVKEGDLEGKKSIVVDRYLVINEGEWPPEKFDNFRTFINQVNHMNSQKAVIIESL